jgi:hypothetical protein
LDLLVLHPRFDNSKKKQVLETMKNTLIGGVADVAPAFSFWTHLLFDSGNVINSALAMGVAYLLFWETYCNAPWHWRFRVAWVSRHFYILLPAEQ